MQIVSLLVTAGIAAASALAVVFILNSEVNQSMDIRDIEISEHADEMVQASSLTLDPVDGNMTNAGKVLTVGYWKKDPITISFFAADLNESEAGQILHQLKKIVKTVNSNSSSNGNYTNWQTVFYDLSNRSANMPSLNLVRDGDDNADIKVFVEGKPHPEGKKGYAKVARDAFNDQITMAEIRIFSSNQLYQDGTIGSIFTHELGHALGLGHATSLYSIMHNRLLIVDGHVVGTIRNCESDAIYNLYGKGVVKDLEC